MIKEFAEAEEPTPVDESAAELERLYQRESDKRREERFFWIFGVILLIDFLAMPNIAWPLGIVIILMELILLAGLAKWLGVEWIAVPLERLYERYLPGGDQKD